MLYLLPMQKKFKHRIAVFFTIIFMALIAAPTVIMTIDDSVDISCFYSLSEEENENIKLPFDNNLQDSESLIIFKIDAHSIGYAYKTYPKPHLNLISPPPELNS